ncbi:MAG: T9SS type A sorting domain-containing protein, partial [bacterium]
AENSELSFWCWYGLPTYGSDGVYVDVSDGAGWTTLDFLGSGGALGRLSVGNDWLEYRYDLSRYPAGTPLMVRFRFVSDDESGLDDGVFIDDVRLGAPAAGEATGIDLPASVPGPRNELFQNVPNPFNPNTTIRFRLADRTPARLEIFDVRGARVRVLLDDVRPPGSNEVFWDGKNAGGERVASGVYFYRLRAGDFQQTRKMVLPLDYTGKRWLYT